jgi:AcrR family transcriptional regulator
VTERGPAREARRPGRPRSEGVRLAILRATNELLTGTTFTELSVDAIAARARASKATIYRWWPSKGAVVLDAFLEEAVPRVGFPDTGSAREDLRQQMHGVIMAMNDTLAGTTLRALIAHMQSDEQLAGQFRERFHMDRRAAAMEVLRRGQRRGELRVGLDPGVVVDALYGALYYRLLVTGARTEPEYADTMLDLFLPALYSRGPHPEPQSRQDQSPG